MNNETQDDSTSGDEGQGELKDVTLGSDEGHVNGDFGNALASSYTSLETRISATSRVYDLLV